MPAHPSISTRRATASAAVVLAAFSLVAAAGAAEAQPAVPVSPGLPADTSTAVVRLAPPPDVVAPQGSLLAAVPALPKAHGFGSRTTGGAGGRVVIVTSEADSASNPLPGTLRYAVNLPGAKWIVFAKDMTVRLAAPLKLTSNTTLDGRGHAVTLTGHGHAGVQIQDVENVIMENLNLHDFGDVALTKDNDPDDAVLIQRSSRIWIDHCSLSMAGDKLIGVTDGAEQLTISWNRFAQQEQTLQLGALSTATSDVRTTATIDHNYFDKVGYRTPVVSYAKAHVYNNYMNAWTSSAVRSERLAQVFVEGNLFRAGANKKASTVAVAQLCNDKKTLCDSRSGYLAGIGNLYVGKVTTADTGRGHVFDPAKAYDYVAEPASLAMGQRIADDAGAYPHITPSTGALPGTVAKPRPVARVTAALRGRNTRRGADVLAVSTRGPVRTKPTVKLARRVGSHWVAVRYARLTTAGRVTVVVRDHKKRARSTYRATMVASGRLIATNTIRLR